MQANVEKLLFSEQIRLNGNARQFNATFGGEMSAESDSGPQASCSRQPKTCRVCGDLAKGYNFNVITCEPCRAFFRRNALKPQDLFKCAYNNNCIIDHVTRRVCKSCRLQKCFEVRMRKDWIQTEDQLRHRKNSRYGRGSL
ncbi:hypothetical protein L596_016966 [Steinernema carpocapsae]|uniref:Nuclear receptor domain-containing protein n=1 Tax=Steinernema carpocapsae TaxID=34508 RepID=A0A4U5N0Z1_STECR|nr:hypothetical protein L596_016966 [Steinernema carpocapsae]